MSDRIDQAAAFSRMVDEHRKACDHFRCVNWKCDGTRHFDHDFEKWGTGWAEVEVGLPDKEDNEI